MVTAETKSLFYHTVIQLSWFCFLISSVGPFFFCELVFGVAAAPTKDTHTHAHTHTHAQTHTHYRGA